MLYSSFLREAVLVLYGVGTKGIPSQQKRAPPELSFALL